MFDRIKRFTQRVVFENVHKAKEDHFITDLSVQNFAEIFGIEVTYVDKNYAENEEPPQLTVNLNFNKKYCSYNPFIKTLEVNGSYLFVDGLLKFERFPQHPDSRVVLFITTLDHLDAENLKRSVE
jgi:hypothetical protein